MFFASSGKKALTPPLTKILWTPLHHTDPAARYASSVNKKMLIDGSDLVVGGLGGLNPPQQFSQPPSSFYEICLGVDSNLPAL